MIADKIKASLEEMRDPDLNRTFGELGAVSKIEQEGNLVNVYLELVPPIRWIAKDVDTAAKKRIRDIDPNLEPVVMVREREIPRVAQKNVLPNVQNLIAVASGKGGVGKSTIAANIAAALAQKGAPTGLLDADVYGPSQPTMFDMAGQQMEAVKLDDGRVIGYPNEQYGVKVASIGFVMARDQAAILRGPMLAGHFSMLVDQVAWGDLEFLVFDLPPGTGDVQLTLTQRVPLTGAVIVTTPQDISLADVRRSISMFKKVNVDILGVVENMSYFVPPDMPDKSYKIFGEGGGKIVADEAGVPFLGEVPLTIPTRKGADEGFPVVLNPEDMAQGDVIRAITAQIVSKVRVINFGRTLTPTVQISL